jgi:uncharacterized membrane protein
MDSALLYAASVRWLHILAGIVWIGLLYYFNYVQAWSFPKMEAAARANATQILLPRALLWFRWAALVTWLAGVLLIISYAFMIPGYMGSSRFNLILVGGLMGTIMLVNVWGIIWPNQKRIIEATNNTVANAAPAPPDQPKWARRAFLASRFNTLFSIPLIFFMVAAPPLLGQLATK